MFSSNRASIKQFLIPYCEQVGSEIGTDDLAEVISTIILDHKRGKCACSNETATPVQSSAIVSPMPLGSLADDLAELLKADSDEN
jgi:hypothetical protein